MTKLGILSLYVGTIPLSESMGQNLTASKLGFSTATTMKLGPRVYHLINIK